MPQDLVSIERQAINAQNAGDFEGAVNLWLKIVGTAPNWEHGYAYYGLAGCYGMLGLYDKAEEAYRQAIKVAPEDDLFSSSLESFLEARKSGVLK